MDNEPNEESYVGCRFSMSESERMLSASSVQLLCFDPWGISSAHNQLCSVVLVSFVAVTKKIGASPFSIYTESNIKYPKWPEMNPFVPEMQYIDQLWVAS